MGAIHLAHAARANRSDDAIGTEGGSWLENQTAIIAAASLSRTPRNRFEHRRRLRNRRAVVPRLRPAEVDAARAAHHRLAVAERAGARLHDAQL